MSKQRYPIVLDLVASDHVPEDVNLLPRIAAEFQSKDIPQMKPHRSLFLTLVLVLIGLALISTAAYALYTYFGDSGLQSVRDAGLGVSPDITAQPTLLPQRTPTAIPTLASPTEETHQETTVKLDWVELTELGLALQFSAQDLPAGHSLGLPQVQFGALQPDQYRGATLALTETGGGLTGAFYTYQLLRAESDPAQVDLSIRIPLLDDASPSAEPVAVFMFEPKAVPLQRYQLNQQQTYAVRYDGLTLRLENLIVSPHRTLAQLCAPLSEAGSEWTIQKASLAWLDQRGQPTGSPAAFDAFQSMDQAGDSRCGMLSFPVGSSQAGPVALLTIQELAQPGARPGKWEFYANLPILGQEAGAAIAQAPLSAETIGSLTAHLKWAFADASRIAMEVTFEGWQSNYTLMGAALNDTAGSPIGSGWAGPYRVDQPERALITLSLENFRKIETGRITASVDLPVYDLNHMDAPLASFRFDLDLPVYPEKTMTIGQAITAGGIEMRLEKLTMTASYTSLVLCYQKPSHTGNSDWMVPYQTQFASGGYQVKLERYSLLHDSDYDLQSPSALQLPGGAGRCVEIGLPLGHFNQNHPAQFTLTVPRLEKSMPEVILDADIRAANEKLQAEGIEITFASHSGTGGGGSGPVILRKPEGMEDQEVFYRFFNALGYYYSGPWEFTFTVEP